MPTRFPRFDVTGPVRMYEQVLRATYNRLIHRRNFNMRGFYDVYTAKRTRASAKHSFQILGEKLLQHGIEPQLYMRVMSNYGVKNTRNLHHPKFLCSDKALEVFHWMHRKERAKYPDEVSFKKGTTQGGELTNDEIVASIKGSKRFIRAAPVRAFFLHRDMLSNWFLAMSDEFIDSEWFKICEPNRRTWIKYSRKHIHRNTTLLKRALKAFKGE